MSFTREEIDTIKKDRNMKVLANLFGVNFDEMLKEMEEELKESETRSKNTSDTKEEEKEYYADGEMPSEGEWESSFSMSCEELKEFIIDYKKLENTFRKLEHTFGIDLNANADSIYTQYNKIVWNLIEKIFGQDNRDDIADFCFGDSNFDSIEDLYEELV